MGPTSGALRRYPAAERLDAVENLHGRRVADPYRWLEDSADPRTLAWQAEQDEAAEAALARLPGRAGFRSQIADLMELESSELPVWRGDREFYTVRRAGGGQVLVRVDQLGEVPQVVVDPARSHPEHPMLGGWTPSIEGDRLAYWVSGVDEEALLYVIDVPTGVLLDGPYDRCRHTSVAWERGGRSFYFVRRLPPTEVPAHERQYHRRVWRRDLTEPPGALAEVGGLEPSITSTFRLDTSPDGRWLTVSARDGAQRCNDIRLMDLNDGASKPRDVQVGTGARTVPTWHGGHLFLLTDQDALDGRLAITDLDDPTRQWRDVLPEEPGVCLQHAVAVGGGVLAAHLVAAQSRLTWYPGGNAPPVVVSLPGLGTITGLAQRPDGGPMVWIGFTGYGQPSSVWCWSADAPRSVRLWRGVDAGQIGLTVVERWYRSADGTPVHAFVIASTAVPDTPRPTILSGYGGFGVALTPRYLPPAICWVKAGGVYVVANVRGGGEFGRAWHLAGRRDRKPRTFDDIDAVADGLVADGWTTTERLGLSGSSNGGLLVGAAVTRSPHRLAAAYCAAALLDMVRYERYGLGRLWVDEYGTSSRPEELSWLLSYSPYHHVRPGVAYPAVLLGTFEDDTRVHPMHARKMCAALQYATVGTGEILLRRERAAGHAAPFVDVVAAVWADELAFFAHHLALAGAPASRQPFRVTKGVIMTRDEIRAELVEILAEIVDLDPNAVRDEQVFAEDLDVDSLGMVEVLVAVEEKFGVSIPDERATELRTVGNVVDVVEQAVRLVQG